METMSSLMQLQPFFWKNFWHYRLPTHQKKEEIQKQLDFFACNQMKQMIEPMQTGYKSYAESKRQESLSLPQ